MRQLIQNIYDSHFNKILLAILFLSIVGCAVHLMHKSDAGGDDASFILWATNTASMILGRLTSMMPADAKSDTDSKTDPSKGTS